MALGGSPRNSTLEVAIYQYALFDLNFNKAIILSLVQIIICIFFVSIGFYKFRGSSFFEVGELKNHHPHKDLIFVKLIDYILVIFFSIFLFSPIIIIYLETLKSNFSNVIFDPNFIKAFNNSLIISLTTGIFVSLIGLTISCILVLNHRNIFVQQSIFLISSIILIISPIIFSLGYFIFFQSYIHYEYIKIIIVILINCIFLLPFAILIIFNNLKNIYLTFDDYRKTYRVNLINYFKIIFPLFKNNFLYVFSISTVITFGDFTIISFFRSGSFETLPSYLFKLISTYKFDEAAFVAGVMLLISMIIYFLIDNLNYQGKPDIKT
jgi:thiamine transport system permease protein